jgi:3-hydroxy-9,10-secoandrosta-1,3,5(10)-triene-9,17-dione monooxygenase
MTNFQQAILDLVPHLRKRADDAERKRQLSEETIAQLRETGVFRAFVPRAYGGDERPLSEVFDALTDLATGCASTAWVGSLVAIHNIAASWLEAAGQEEIFGGGPDVLVTSSVAPTGTCTRVAGGYRLAGRWRFSSGVDHAAWIMLGGNVKTSNAPSEYVFSFVRASDVKVIDDWYVTGLRGTGSKSMELNDVFVPNHRSLPLRALHSGAAPGVAQHRNPFYRLPWHPLFVSAFPPAALGTAIAMLEGFREHTATRVSSYSGEPLKGSAAAATRLATAAGQVDAARLVFRRDIAALDQCALQGRPLAPGIAERIVYDAAFVVDSCSRAVLRLFRGSGARALHESSPLQRYFRDIHAMTQHAALDTDDAGESYGKGLVQNSRFPLGARQ